MKKTSKRRSSRKLKANGTDRYLPQAQHRAYNHIRNMRYLEEARKLAADVLRSVTASYENKYDEEDTAPTAEQSAEMHIQALAVTATAGAIVKLCRKTKP